MGMLQGCKWLACIAERLGVSGSGCRVGSFGLELLNSELRLRQQTLSNYGSTRVLGTGSTSQKDITYHQVKHSLGRTCTWNDP